MCLKVTVNLLAYAYAGSNPALPTIFKVNDLESRKAPFLLARIESKSAERVHSFSSSTVLVIVVHFAVRSIA
jgi:hypothetical protein